MCVQTTLNEISSDKCANAEIFFGNGRYSRWCKFEFAAMKEITIAVPEEHYEQLLAYLERNTTAVIVSAEDAAKEEIVPSTDKATMREIKRLVSLGRESAEKL
jgi:hypothetical protein